MSISRDELSRVRYGDTVDAGTLPPVTPGEVLRDEFMVPLGLSARALARDLGVPPNRITDIVNGDRGVTAETAILLGRRFETSARFWMNLQVAHDLAVAEQRELHAA